jgi:hypothetical protein
MFMIPTVRVGVSGAEFELGPEGTKVPKTDIRIT